MKRIIAFALLPAALSCGDSTGPAAPANLIPVSGDDQEAVVGNTLIDSLVVRVEDAKGNGVGGIVVSWKIREGGGSVDPESATTNSEGLAATAWTLGTSVGTNQAQANTEALSAATFTAQANPGPAAAVTVEPDSLRFTALADSVQLFAEVSDVYGNSLPTTVTWTSDDVQVATATDAGWVAASGGGSTVVWATAGAAADSVIAEVRQTVSTVTLDAVADTVFVGDSLYLDATAVDSNGYPVEDVSISWTASDTAVIDVDTSGTAVARAEGQTEIVASVNGIADTTGTITVNPAWMAIEWSTIDLSQYTTDLLFSAEALDSLNIFVGTGNGGIIHYDGANWTRTSAPCGEYNYRVYDFWADRDSGNLFGVAGCIIELVDNVWERHTTPAINTPTTIWGLSSEEIYTGTDDGLLQYDGAVWTQVQFEDPNIPERLRIRGLGGRGGHDIWAVGMEGLALHYDGAAWHFVPTDYYRDFGATWTFNGGPTYIGNLLDIDGEWTEHPELPEPSTINDAVEAYPGVWFVMTPQGLYASDDGDAWVQIMGVPGEYFSRPGSVPGKLLLVPVEETLYIGRFTRPAG